MLRTVFKAPDDRLRIGWRLALYLLAWLLVFALTGGVLRSVLAALPLPASVRGLVVAAVAFALLTWVTRLFRRKLDRRDLRGLGLNRPGAARWTAFGFLVGTGMMVLVAAIQWALGWIQVQQVRADTLGIWQTADLLASGVVAFAVVGFVEEVLFRGYYFQNLGERYSVGTAVLVSGVVFGMLHVQSGGFGFRFVASAVVITVFLVLGRLGSGSLWWPIGWHAGWNFWQDTMFGLSRVHEAEPKSLLVLEQQGPPLWVGVAPSIEGGLLVILVELLGIVALWAWARRRGAAPRFGDRLDETGAIAREAPAL